MKLGAFPWHIGIYMYQGNAAPDYVCGGSIINEKVVLTGMVKANFKKLFNTDLKGKHKRIIAFRNKLFNITVTTTSQNSEFIYTF